MATKLNKDVTRESKVIADERNIMVTLTEKQEISLKLKGMKSGAVKIKIKDLYHQLSDNDKKETKNESLIIKQNKKNNKVPMINLNDFRSQYLIDGDLSYDVKAKLDRITTKLIKENNKK